MAQGPGTPDTIEDERKPATGERGARLDSWKEIAAYLNRDVRTVQRWEKSAALPVRRLQKSGLRAVYAYVADLDAWRRDQEPSAEDDVVPEAAPPVAAAKTPPPSAPQRWRF